MRRRAFTLIELLAVIAVIGLLIALILPAVQVARERARATECLSHLRQLGVALANYESSHGVFPPSFVRQDDGNPAPPSVPMATLRYRSHWTGFHMLLPFMEQDNLADRYDWDDTWLSALDDPSDRSMWALNRTYLSILVCPSAPHRSRTIGASGTSGGDGGLVTTEGGFTSEGDPGSGAHWMSGAPTDYSFSHGADIIRDLPGSGGGCPDDPIRYWRDRPQSAKGPFGYSSACRAAEVNDGMSQTIFMGEKAGGLLTYGGWTSGLPTMTVEYPWAMAAVAYFGPTGGESEPNSAWITGPYAVTHDFKSPACPSDPVGSGIPFPMNPVPRTVPMSSTERPFYSFQGPHPGGAFFLFGDGSVRFLGSTINQRTYEALSTISGGEVTDAG